MWLRFFSILLFVTCVAIAIWGMKLGMFSSQQTMKRVLLRAGVLGPIFFTILQIVQVVIPIIPGGVSCLAGVVLFGAWQGFICNYIGICLGSFIAFGFAKIFGRPLLLKIFGKKMLDKYDVWTKDKERFDHLFALAIFLPVAPDDFLCYLAGTTAMSWYKFIIIILFGKPLAIAAYSLLLNTIWLKVLLG